MKDRIKPLFAGLVCLILSTMVTSCHLGMTPEEMYKKGKDYDEVGNYTKAVRWYKRAAEEGHMEAQMNLAMCYYLGKGVEKDHEKARYWYEEVKEEGRKRAEEMREYMQFIMDDAEK